MRRLGLAIALSACALAGSLTAVVVAGASPRALLETTLGTTTGATTTAPTTTTGPTTSTTPPPPPPPTTVPADVTVGGVPVGGLDQAGAETAVRAAFSRPLPVRVAGRTLTPAPSGFGAVAYVRPAVRRALRAAPGTEVSLLVRVKGAKVRAYVARLAKRFDRNPVDARLRLRKLKPVIAPDRPGRSLDRVAATRAIVGRLLRNGRAPVALRMRGVPASVTRGSYRSVIVIRRGSNRLFLYRGTRLFRTFGVATGQTAYPTPLGRFSIIVMSRNPWWYPPSSDWADGLDPVPPGPGNPLGTRWMGISSPGVGIHGTPDAASIGYSASHGCIRMRIPDAEWLFAHVTVGTPVFVVAA